MGWGQRVGAGLFVAGGFWRGMADLRSDPERGINGGSMVPRKSVQRFLAWEATLPPPLPGREGSCGMASRMGGGGGGWGGGVRSRRWVLWVVDSGEQKIVSPRWGLLVKIPRPAPGARAPGYRLSPLLGLVGGWRVLAWDWWIQG